MLHRVRTLSSYGKLLTQHFHHHGQRGSGRLWIRNGYHVVVYDRSMEMDGPCAVYRCMTDGKLENVEFLSDGKSLLYLTSSICLSVCLQKKFKMEKWVRDKAGIGLCLANHFKKGLRLTSCKSLNNLLQVFQQQISKNIKLAGVGLSWN